MHPLLTAYLDATEAHERAIDAVGEWDGVAPRKVRVAFSRLLAARRAWKDAGFPRLSPPPVVGPDEWAEAPDVAPEPSPFVDLSSAIDPDDLPYLPQE